MKCVSPYNCFSLSSLLAHSIQLQSILQIYFLLVKPPPEVFNEGLSSWIDVTPALFLWPPECLIVLLMFSSKETLPGNLVIIVLQLKLLNQREEGGGKSPSPALTLEKD